MADGGNLRPDGLKVQAVQLLVLDVDGVLTDGSVIMDDSGRDIYSFHVRDGSALVYWHRLGFRSAIITGRASSAVTLRAAQLGIDFLYQNAKRKLEAYRKCLQDARVLPEQVCYVGDDLPDIPVMNNCGYPIAVANAVDEVKAICSYTTSVPGGQGAVREVVEHLLKTKGRWQELLDGYCVQRIKD